jgi:hypothetical protein
MSMYIILVIHEMINGLKNNGNAGSCDRQTHIHTHTHTHKQTNSYTHTDTFIQEYPEFSSYSMNSCMDSLHAPARLTFASLIQRRGYAGIYACKSVIRTSNTEPSDEPIHVCHGFCIIIPARAWTTAKTQKHFCSNGLFPPFCKINNE